MDDSAWVERTNRQVSEALSRLRTIRDEFSTIRRPQLDQLSRELDRAFAAWDAAITAYAAAPPESDASASRRPMREIVDDAESLLAALMRDASELADAIASESGATEDWERRAVVTIQEGRDQQAKDAFARLREHVDRREELSAELHFVESMCDSLRETIAEARASTPS